MKRTALYWSLGLTAGLIVSLVLNALANALPLFGRATGEISDSLPNLFVPAGITFSIWGVIYLAVVVFTIYQLVRVLASPGSPPDWFGAIAPAVLVIHLANALWIVLWHALLLKLSLVVMLLLFAALAVTVRRLQWSQRGCSRVEYWAVRVPFSLYFGWITVALPANVTAVLVAAGVRDLVPGAAFWAAGLAAVAALLGMVAVLRYRDIAYGLVISWALAGIALARSPGVPWLSGWAAGLAGALLVVILLTAAGVPVSRGRGRAVLGPGSRVAGDPAGRAT